MNGCTFFKVFAVLVCNLYSKCLSFPPTASEIFLILVDKVPNRLSISPDLTLDVALSLTSESFAILAACDCVGCSCDCYW